eukprot:evm.model.scf_22.8 EVM.evm.TU.scf_22.8   scf_22:118500-127836(+)
MVARPTARCSICFLWFCLHIHATKDNWQPASRGRFPSMVSVKGRGRSHVCSGVLIGSRFIITTANCVDVVGPNPIVAVGARDIDDDRWDDGVEELRVERAHRHPNWTGSIYDGYDVALLQLPREIIAPMPRMANESTAPHPNTKVHSLVFEQSLEAGLFVVVNPELCPNMGTLSPDMFCIYSSTSGMQPGSSGGPVLILNGALNSNSDGLVDESQQPSKDLLLGVVSCSNFSSLEESGIGCTAVSAFRPWINSIVSPQVDAIDDPTNIAGVVVFIFFLMAAAFFGPQEAAFPFQTEMHLVKRNRDQVTDHSENCAFETTAHAVVFFCIYAIILCSCIAVIWSHFGEGGIVAIVAAGVISSYLVLNFISKAMGMRGKAASMDQLRQIGNVPNVCKHYVHRGKAEDDIQEWLTDQPADDSHPRVAIVGMAGIGKTALGTSVINSIKALAHFWSGIFWLQSGAPGPDAVLAIIREIHRRMTEMFVDGPFVADREQAGLGVDDLVTRINNKLRRRSCLLVLDGVLDPKMLESVLKLRCALLVTSQVKGIFDNHVQFKRVEVLPLDFVSSRKLFLNLVPAAVQLKGVEELLQSCGGHPLALSIMGTLFQDAMRAEGAASAAAIDDLMAELRDPYCRLQMRIKSDVVLHSADVERHSNVSRCFDFALDALSWNERKVYMSLEALPIGFQSTIGELGTVWNLQDDQALQMAEKLERHFLIQREVCSEGSKTVPTLWVLHSLQHDYLKMLRVSAPQNVPQQ